MNSSARRVALGLLASLVLTLPLLAAPFTPGNVVIYRVGTGAAALASSGTAVFLDEYTPGGVLVQSLALPTAVSGSQRRLVASGTATTEGMLTRSVDGQFLVLPGYDADLGTASITGSASSAVNRVIGRVDANATIDTSTALTDAISGGNPRSAAATNGVDLWISGTSSGGGVRYAVFGATTSTSLATTPTNLRALGIAGGQLYVSSQTGAFRLSTVGAGTPTTSGQTITNLPGFPTATGSPQAFAFADLDAGVAGVDTVYWADDGGTIQKYSLVAGTWTSNGTITASTVRGLTASVSGTTVTLYATYSNGSRLATVVDTAGYNAAPSTTAVTDLATAGTNTAFRGVALAPVSAADVAPTVTSTTPVDGATGVATSVAPTVTFSEPVNAAAGAFILECPVATPVAFTISGGPTTFTLTPSAALPAGTICTATVVAANISDQDANDPPDTMAANFAWSFTTASPLPALSIGDVSIAEGNSGQTQMTFTVTLSAPSATPVQFDFTTADGTATTADNDYLLTSEVPATIPIGNTTYPFAVTINGDTSVEPDETFFVNLSNPVNAVISDGQAIGTILNDDFTPIHTIQGNGLASTYDGSVVTTTGVVTALKFNNGFFIQEPDATVDADPQTSEGLFVYTGSAPTVAVGDFVRVTGTVDEYVQSGNFGALTELVAPLTITVVSSGNPLPAPVALTTTMPSPAGSWYQLEHLEGMRVGVPGFVVAAATDGNPGGNYTTGTSYGDCYGVVPGLDRPFREPGIAFPNDPPSGTTIPPLLRFDSNPELLRMDTDGQVGATRHNLSARTVLPGFEGVLDYAFSRYSILPDVGSLPASPAEFAPTAVTAPLASEFTVAAYNLQRFFDDVNDPAIGEPVLTTAQYAARLAKASVGIRNYMRTPDVVGVVEVENLTTLQALATRISNDAVAAAQPDPLYQAYLIEGNDVGGIDVGFLVKTSLAGASPRVEVLSVTQELDGTLFTNPDASTEILNDRPPLVLRAVIHGANGGTHPVTVIVNHLRSLSGVDSEDAGSFGWTTLGQRVRAKRHAQAVDLANFVQGLQTADPTEQVILVGDFNSFDVNDSLGHSVATIAGTPVVDDTTAVPGDGVDLVNPDLVNLGPLVSAGERYSYVYEFTPQMIDHALVNAALVTGSLARRVEFARINADFPEVDRPTTDVRLSDHDPLVVFVQSPALLTAGITTTIVDTPDPVFPGAGLTYTITVTNGGPDAATGLTLTDALPAGTLFASLTAPAGWGCVTPVAGANGTVTCTASTLAASSSAVFTLSVTVDPAVTPGSVLSNTASVTQTSTEGTPGDESATATTTVQTPPDVYATKSVSGVAFPGATLTYTVVLYNNGTTPQLDNPGDELVDVLPASLTLVSATAASGTAVATVATNTVTWNGSIPAGGSVTVTITALVGGGAGLGDVISNQATVSYDANGDGTNESSASSDDPATGTLGDATSITVTLGAGGVAVIPAAGTVGLGLLALLVALGGALLVGRRLA